MLLSQAILLGSMLSKQGFGLYGKGDEGRCALEAVADVTGAAGLNAFDDELYDRVKGYGRGSTNSLNNRIPDE